MYIGLCKFQQTYTGLEGFLFHSANGDSPFPPESWAYVVTYALFVVQRRLCLLHYFARAVQNMGLAFHLTWKLIHSKLSSPLWWRREEGQKGRRVTTWIPTRNLSLPLVLSIDYLASRDLFLMWNVSDTMVFLWTLTHKHLSWYSDCVPNLFILISYHWPAQAQNIPSFTRVDDQQNNLPLPALTYNNVHLSCTHQCPERSHGTY